LRERYPERSIYNALCDMEWDQPQGATRTFGGIIVVRVSAFDGVRGFREDVVAGEEPELAIRLRRAGWTSWRLQDEMATHDAGITRFSQWWLRAVRYGHASAQLASLHARSGESSLVRGVASAWVWAAGIPLAACIAWLLGGSAAAALCLAAYPLQVARLALGGNASARRSWSRALFLVIGKFAEAWGQARFAVRDLGGAAPRIIEYK
jgi:GT2 family glycosyltransferase